MRNNELLKVGALNVSDRVKQLKMNHVFKIRNQTSPSYMLSNFNRLNANNNRMTKRASATDFFVPGVSGQCRSKRKVPRKLSTHNSTNCLLSQNHFYEKMDEFLVKYDMRTDVVCHLYRWQLSSHVRT